MNKFVKGAKNLALVLFFVSVCACNSVENADLNVVNKEFGPREKDNVNGNKHIILREIDEGVISETEEGVISETEEGVISKTEEGVISEIEEGVISESEEDLTNECEDNVEKNENFEQFSSVEDCIDEKGCVSWKLLLNKFNYNLSGVVFTVDKNEEYFDYKCYGKLVSFPPLSDSISLICKYGGVLKAGKNLKKKKISFVEDNKIQIYGEDFDGFLLVLVISNLGRLNPEVFNILYDCGNMVIEGGKINGYSFTGLGNSLFVNGCDLETFDSLSLRLCYCDRKSRDLFLKGFALLLGVKECKIKMCRADGTISEIETENTRHGIFGGGKYVLLD